ncbi:MAG: protein kinase, partial [Bacteroidota bacterium]
IGEALQEAHSKGIVHRDIKADNIMVNAKNQIKVMDFGLAKLKGSLKLTRTSSTVGTLAYMSPEQVQGGEIDARSDIFSFGVVLFEMLAGQTPFRGEHEAAMVYSIVNEEPEPVQKYRPELSSEFLHILNKALEKNPEERYQSVSEMVVDLRRLKKESTKFPRPSMERQIVDIESTQKPTEPHAGFPKSSSRKLLVIVGAAVIAIAVSLVMVFRSPFTSPTESSSERKMLAVLPFETLGPAEQEYFADGITEEITSRLSGLSGLGVIARSSAMQYKKTTKTLKQIGDELGVAYVLEGTVRWETTPEGEKRVRVRPELIKVSDATQIWSQPYEAVFSGVFKLQSDIASQVANALGVTLLQPERESLEAKLTDNSEAYDFYLRGMDYFHRTSDERDLRIAEQMFQRAVELDPKFASAYAKISSLHSSMYWFYYDHTEERVLKAEETAERALQIDPDLPDAHGAMGWYHYHGRLEYDKALKEFSEALKRQPNNTDVLLGIGAVLRRQGKTEEALTNFRKAVEVDPRSATLNQNLGSTYRLLRNYSEAERFLDRAISLSPDWAITYRLKAWTYLMWEANIEKARAALEEARQRKVGEQDPDIIYSLVMIDVFDGRYPSALNRLTAIRVNTFEDQFSFTPKELLLASINGFMKRTQLERAYYDSARTMLEREIRKHPEDARLHSALGIVYAGLGRTEDAIREGKRAVELLPISKEAWRGAYRVGDLARIYTLVGEHDAAIDQLEQLLSMPSDVSVPLLRIDPVWASLHTNTRFQKLIAENK